jgi:hypothetical protein
MALKGVDEFNAFQHVSTAGFNTSNGYSPITP